MSKTKTISTSNQTIDLSNENISKLTVTGSNVIIKNLKMNKLLNKSLLLKGNNITLMNCSFSECEDGNEFIVISGQYNRITNCLFENFNKKGNVIYINLNKSKPNHCLIDNNNFRDCKSEDELICIGNAKTSMYDCKTMILNNFFIECNKNISVNSGKNVITFNKLINCKSSIILRHGNNNLVLNNYINGNHLEGSQFITMYGKGHKIKNNTVENLTSAVYIMCGQENPKLNGYQSVKDCIISDNDFLGCDVVFSLGVNNGVSPNPVKPDKISIMNNNLVKCVDDIDLNEHLLGIDNSFVDNNSIGNNDNTDDFKVDIKKYESISKDLSNLSNEDDIDKLYFTFTDTTIIPDTDEDEEKDFIIADIPEKEENDEMENIFEELERVLDEVESDNKCSMCEDYKKNLNYNLKKHKEQIDELRKELDKFKSFYDKIKSKLILE